MNKAHCLVVSVTFATLLMPSLSANQQVSQQTATRPISHSIAAAPKRPAALDNAGLLAAFRQGAPGQVPDYLSVDSVDFEVLEKSPPSYLIKGTLTYAFVSETFKQVGKVGADALGWIPVLEQVHQSGDKLSNTFNLRARYSGENDSISPPLPDNLRAQGKPRQQWQHSVIKDSKDAQEAAKQAQEFAAARQKLSRIETNVSYARKLLNYVSEDSVRDGIENWRINVVRETDSLGFETVGKAIEAKRLGGYNARERQEMVKLLEREVIPEAKRLTALDAELREKVRAAQRFFSELP